MEQTPQKTFKRELAIAMLVYLAAMFTWGVYDPDGRGIEVATYLTTPIFLFASGAYALDWKTKQG